MKEFIEKQKKFWNQPISLRLFYILFMIIPLFYLLEQLVCAVYDSDMYFIIATGREILNTGHVPHTNVWTIDSSSGIVIQQWLYAVVMALIDKCGHLGFTLFVTAEFVIFAFIWMEFFKMRHVSRSVSLFLLVVASMPVQAYMFSARPQLITMILVMATCLCIEKYAWTKHVRWLFMLPVLVCLEMQFHLSMWPLHFAVILAYAVPAFYCRVINKKVTDDSLACVLIKDHRWIALCATVVFMIGALFINPYGVDGVLYLINTAKGHTFNYVEVIEVAETTFFSRQGAAVIVCLLIMGLVWVSGQLSSTTANICCGFLLLMMMVVRNNTCSIFVMAFLFRDAVKIVAEKAGVIDWRKDLKRNIIPALLFADLIFITNFTDSCQSVFASGEMTMSNNLEAIVQEIEKNYTEDMHIFTGFNDGAYLEYEGFRNLYIDARPEIFTTPFTGDKNILADYSSFCVYGLDVRDAMPSLLSGEEDKKGAYVTSDMMEEWLDEYDFDYIIVTPTVETHLCGYLANDDRYELVDEVSDSFYMLYRKADLYD